MKRISNLLGLKSIGGTTGGWQPENILAWSVAVGGRLPKQDQDGFLPSVHREVGPHVRELTLTSTNSPCSFEDEWRRRSLSTLTSPEDHKWTVAHVTGCTGLWDWLALSGRSISKAEELVTLRSGKLEPPWQTAEVNGAYSGALDFRPESSIMALANHVRPTASLKATRQFKLGEVWEWRKVPDAVPFAEWQAAMSMFAKR